MRTTVIEPDSGNGEASTKSAARVLPTDDFPRLRVMKVARLNRVDGMPHEALPGELLQRFRCRPRCFVATDHAFLVWKSLFAANTSRCFENNRNGQSSLLSLRGIAFKNSHAPGVSEWNLLPTFPTERRSVLLRHHDGHARGSRQNKLFDFSLGASETMQLVDPESFNLF